MSKHSYLQRFGRRIKERDGNWNCHYCGRETIYPEVHHLYSTDPWGDETEKVNYNLLVEVDHRIPKCRGGGDTLDNLVLACHSCNHRKGKLTDVEFKAKIDGAK